MATQVTEDTHVEGSIGLGRGRQFLDRSVWHNGWLMTFLATAEDTQGRFALIEAVGRKGSVPPPHIHHREEESFYVLEGEMTVSVSDRTIKATPGTLVIVPRNTVHSFVIESEQLRVLTLVTPAGLEESIDRVSLDALCLLKPLGSTSPSPSGTDVSRRTRKICLPTKSVRPLMWQLPFGRNTGLNCVNPDEGWRGKAILVPDRNAEVAQRI